jgi:hypothetical protein
VPPRIPDLAPAADLAARAVSGVAAGSASILAAGAKLADLTRARGDHRTPVMPPELVARVDKALADEVARRSSMSSPLPEPRPVSGSEQLAKGRGDWLNLVNRVPMPRAPLAGS